MKICIISDTHGLHSHMIHPLTEAEILIHAGDTCNIGIESDVRQFVEWFQNLKGFDSKIFVAGNHDWGFYHKKPWLYHYINDENLSQSDCYYLEDSFMTITDPEFSRPIKIYGTPWQPDFCNWAFNVPRDKLYLYWEKIPLDTDILITHGPPQGIGDINLEGESCGCSSLRYYVEKIKPVLCISGHIHEGYSTNIVGDTTFINASICTRRYVPSNKPIVVDITEVDGKLITNIIENE
jgi:hypothetical protein